MQRWKASTERLPPVARNAKNLNVGHQLFARPMTLQVFNIFIQFSAFSVCLLSAYFVAAQKQLLLLIHFCFEVVGLGHTSLCFHNTHVTANYESEVKTKLYNKVRVVLIHA